MPKRTFDLGSKTVLLDARPDRLDLRDRPYTPPVRSLPPCSPDDELLRRQLPAYIKHGLILDQGQEGACTGYGLAATVNFLLWKRAVVDGRQADFAGVSPHMLYDLARFYDEWPGEDYEGSSCRGAVKGWNKHGACAQPLWRQSVHGAGRRRYRPDAGWAVDAIARPLGVYYRIDSRSVTDMQAAIADLGAIYVSAAVHAGWHLAPARRGSAAKGHAALPEIPYAAGDPDTGGHAFALVGYNARGFVVQNSWGTDWGAQGFAVLGYSDWLDHGTDAWVCSLGVPQIAHATAAPARARRINSSMVSGDNPPTAITGTGAGRTTAAAPPSWDNDTAYEHTLVAGDNGVVRIGRPDIGYAEDLVAHLLLHNIGAWLKGAGRGTGTGTGTGTGKGGGQGGGKIVVYAHGGLNSEQDSIKRIRAMGPYFEANGIYPLFYTWRTGFLETTGTALSDAVGWGAGLAGTTLATGALRDAADGLIEATAHGNKWVWNQMKDNAAGAALPGRALDLLALNLAKLQQAAPGVEVHLIGHSAGSFVHGYLLDLCLQRALTISSVTLYAPACPLDFAAQHYQARIADGTLGADRFWMHVLSDQREQEDTVGPYRKSLLYLVDRGFENVRKTPLAGLQRAQDGRYTQHDDDLWAPAYWPQVAAWRAWLAALPAQADGLPACEVVRNDCIHVSTSKTVAPSHGGFDNDIRVVGRSINRVLGRSPDAALAVPIEDLEF